MFEQTLLESSPRRLPVLRRIHYLISTVFGTVVFAAGLQVIPAVLMTPAPRAVFATSALGGMAAALEALMVCYVWAGCRRQGLLAWLWVAMTLILSLPGFLVYLVYAAAKTGDWKRASIPLAYVAEALLVGVLILVPLIYTQALPKVMLIADVHVPPPAGPPPAPTGASHPRPTHPVAINPLQAPPSIPVGVRMIVERRDPGQAFPIAGTWIPDAIPGGGPPGQLGVLGGLGNGTPPLPPTPERHTERKQQIIHVGGVVIEAQAIYHPAPVYPPLAMIARVQGTVTLEAIIGTDGRVQNLKVVSGHAMLVSAALNAVKTWRYQPTLLNGEPVEVQTEINVNFTLGQ